MKVEYTKNNTKIYDCYLLDNKQIRSIAEEIELARLNKELPQTRSRGSYYYEIKAHKRLYKLGLFRIHTKDCDCEENIKKWKDRLFRIIGG